MSFDFKEAEAIVEAILFAAGEPISLSRLAQATGMDSDVLLVVLQRYGDRLSFERRGIRLLKLDDSYQLCSPPEYADYVRAALESRKPAPLSQPALEVLSIVAYYQPTTRAYIDQIRGVDSGYTTNLLAEKGLIEECGRLDVPGRPALFKTTENFLRAFGLSSLADLPELPSMDEDGQMSFAQTLQQAEENTENN